MVPTAGRLGRPGPPGRRSGRCRHGSRRADRDARRAPRRRRSSTPSATTAACRSSTGTESTSASASTSTSASTPSSGATARPTVFWCRFMPFVRGVLLAAGRDLADAEALFLHVTRCSARRSSASAWPISATSPATTSTRSSPSLHKAALPIVAAAGRGDRRRASWRCARARRRRSADLAPPSGA